MEAVRNAKECFYDILSPSERKVLTLQNQYKKCACCLKEIYLPGNASEYAYKRKLKYGRTEYYCSWTCLRNKEVGKRYRSGK